MSEAQPTFQSVFSTRLTPTLLRGLGLSASPRRSGGSPELEFDPKMSDGLLGEGKAQTLLAKAGGEKLYARPKLDRSPAGVRPFTRSQALDALGRGDEFKCKSVGGALYVRVTRAILADVDTPPARPEPPSRGRKRASVGSGRAMDADVAMSAENVKKRKSEEAVRELQQRRKKEKAEEKATATSESKDRQVQQIIRKASKLGKLRSMTAKRKKEEAKEKKKKEEAKEKKKKGKGKK